MKNLDRIKKIFLALSLGTAMTALNGQDFTRALPAQGGHGMVTAKRIGGPEHQMMFDMAIDKGGPQTFLGVHAVPVDPTLSAQLGLPEHMGLAIRYVVPDSPAEKAGLKPHDILRQMDDQILIHPVQLRVLVRTHKEGDKVIYTILRGGEEMQVEAELIKKEPAKHEKIIKMGLGLPMPGHPGMPFRLNLNGDASLDLNFDYLDEDIEILVENAGRAGENIEQIISKVFNHTSEVADHVINSLNGRSTIIKMKEKEIILKDEDGTMSLTVHDGSKHLRVTDGEDSVLFDGPVNTAEERSEIPEYILPKLQKLESENNFEFDFDEEFEPGEIEIIPSTSGMGVTAQNSASSTTFKPNTNTITF